MVIYETVISISGQKLREGVCRHPRYQAIVIFGQVAIRCKSAAPSLSLSKVSHFSRLRRRRRRRRPRLRLVALLPETKLTLNDF